MKITLAVQPDQITTLQNQPYLKQVIVMRTDLNMRKGKMIVQGAHASIACMFGEHGNEIRGWLLQGMTKICVRCDSEAELLDIEAKALGAGLRVFLVTDAGRTEFNGPTRTCLAIGPNEAEKIDAITGGLKLL